MVDLLFKKYKKKPFGILLNYLAMLFSGASLSFLSFLILPNLLQGSYARSVARYMAFLLIINFFSFLLTVAAAVKTRRFIKNFKSFESSGIELVEKDKKTDKTFCAKCGIILTREDFKPSKKGIKLHYFNGFKGYYCKNCFIRHAILVFISFLLLIKYFLFTFMPVNIYSIVIDSGILLGFTLEMGFWYRYYKRYV
ncbi:MAG: hypothetical protein EU529_12275 [Promethearchaeota archaeon]|nr:MAG: hypothetical protein EU529_12275 [Candidatus Lokiarchaeota archaeon]